MRRPADTPPVPPLPHTVGLSRRALRVAAPSRMRPRSQLWLLRNGGRGRGFAGLGEALLAASGADGECLSSSPFGLLCFSSGAPVEGKQSGRGAGKGKRIRWGNCPAESRGPVRLLPFSSARFYPALAWSFLWPGVRRLVFGVSPVTLAGEGPRERDCQGCMGPCAPLVHSIPSVPFFFLACFLLLPSWGWLLGDNGLWLWPPALGSERRSLRLWTASLRAEKGSGCDVLEKGPWKSMAGAAPQVPSPR